MIATSSFAASGGSINDPNIPLNDKWELQPSMVEKDFLEADIALISGFDSDMIRDVREAGEGRGASVIGAFTTEQTKAYKLIRAGVRSVVIF
jgi:hypothetical protein